MIQNNLFKQSCFDMSYRCAASQPKVRPMYYQELLCYPKMNPIFITAEYSSLCFMHRLKFNCLFCAKAIDRYDVNFSFNREVWVLYSKQVYFTKTMQLAQAVQLSGASKILVLLVNQESRGGKNGKH